MFEASDSTGISDISDFENDERNNDFLEQRSDLVSDMSGISDSDIENKFLEQREMFFESIKENNITKIRNTMVETFFDNSLENLVGSTDPESDLEKPAIVVAAETLVDYDILQLLIFNGVHINGTDSNFRSALHYLTSMTPSESINHRIFSFAQSLIFNGIDVFIKDKDGKTALDLALEQPENKRNKQLIEVIRDRIDVQPTYKELINIIDNVDEKPIDTVLSDLEKLPLTDYIVGVEDSEGLNSLMYAIKYFAEPQHLTSIYNLIESKEKDILELTLHGKTAPMVFLERYPVYNPETVGFLRTLINDMTSYINEQDLFGLTVLDYAEKTQQPEYISIVESILGAKRGANLPPISETSSLFLGERAIYPENILPETPSTPRTPATPATPRTPSTPRTPDPMTPDTPMSPDPMTPDTPMSPDPMTPGTPQTRSTPLAPPDIREERQEMRSQAPPPRMGLFSEPEEEETLPDDKEELKTLLKKNIDLLKAKEEVIKASSMIEKIIKKEPSLANEPMEPEHETVIFASLYLVDGSYVQTLFLKTLSKVDIDPTIKNKDGKTILEKAVHDNKFGLVKKILMFFKLKDLITSFKNARDIYSNLDKKYYENVESTQSTKNSIKQANEEYQEAEEKLDNLRREGKKDDEFLEREREAKEQLKRLENKIVELEKEKTERIEEKKNILYVLDSMFEVMVITGLDSSSEDNYTILPDKLNKNATNITDFDFYMMSICVGEFNHDEFSGNANIILNDFKFFEFFLKNGYPVYQGATTDFKNTVLGTILGRKQLSVDMTKMALEYGSQISLLYEKDANTGEFVNNVISNLQARDGDERLKTEIIDLLRKGIAVQAILITPYTEYLDPQIFEERDEIIANLYEFHPEAFESYKKAPGTENLTEKEINPKDETFDVIMQMDTEIGEFLEEDPDVNVVIRDYDNPASTLLIDINEIRKKIEVDFTPVNTELGEIDEASVDMYDPSNPNHVPGAGKKGGAAVVFKCIEFLEGGFVTYNKVNNMEPYFDLKSVSVVGGLIPVLEIYSKLLLPEPAKRGQYFTYKISDKRLDPLSSISSVIYPGSSGMNRYGGYLNYVSAAHCQEGQYGNQTTIVKAKELKVRSGGRKMKKNKTKTVKKTKGMKKGKSKTLRRFIH
jgi:ankyrin repeat protein